MQIVFIYPDIITDRKGWKGQYHYGIGLMSSNAKKAGHETALIHIPKEITRSQLLDKISKVIKPNSIVAISSTSNTFQYLVKYSRWIKKSFDAPILCGGIHPTLNPEETINLKDVDIVCLGEGEETIVEVCNKLDKNEEIINIEGLWVKKDGKIYKNSQRKLIEDLDKLPFADRGIFDYKNMYWEKQGIGSFMASRGCPFDCSYCCNHSLAKCYKGKGKYVRFRSVDNTIKEIEEVVSRYSFIRAVVFDDDILGMKKDWLKEFSEKYRNKIGLPFICNFRANLLDEDRVKMLNRAGCIQLNIGIESGNEFILNKILNRNMTRKHIITAFNLCKKYKIRTYSFNMVGIPYENTRRILDTIKLNALLSPYMTQSTIFYPFKGTKIYDLCKREGFLSNKKTTTYFKESICNYPNLSQLVKLYSILYKRKGRLSRGLESILDYLLQIKMTAYFSLICYEPLKIIKRLLTRKQRFFKV